MRPRGHGAEIGESGWIVGVQNPIAPIASLQMLDRHLGPSKCRRTDGNFLGLIPLIFFPHHTSVAAYSPIVP